VFALWRPAREWEAADASHMILLKASMAGRATFSEIFLRANWSITPRISEGVNSRSLIFSVLVVSAFNELTT